MAKGKKKVLSEEVKKSKDTHSSMQIEERLAGCGRHEAEHIIYVGELVERAIKGEFGAILKALTAGRVSTELNANKAGGLSSDRVLGRIEMANNLWDDLEQFVLDKDKLQSPLQGYDDGMQETETP
jgi:hypothetical protein